MLITGESSNITLIFFLWLIKSKLWFLKLWFGITRWSTMIRAEEVQATGTACSDLNTWPLGVIWLLKWVRYVSICLPSYITQLKTWSHTNCSVLSVLSRITLWISVYIHKSIYIHIWFLDSERREQNMKWMRLKRAFNMWVYLPGEPRLWGGECWAAALSKSAWSSCVWVLMLIFLTPI